MRNRSEKLADLFLAVRDGDVVRCGRCKRIVDFGKSCELERGPSGHLDVTRCHECLMEKPPAGLLSAVGHLVDAFGEEGAKVEITRALSLPAPGSHWRYTDPRSPADRLEFSFVRFVGDALVFNGPYGEWICSREDWSNHVATFRVRPFLAPVRAQA